MSAFEHLDAARAALRAGDVLGCGQALRRFEACLGSAPPAPAEAERLLDGLARLGELTRAAMQGVADARLHLRRTLADAQEVAVYTSDGRRETRRLHPAALKRF